MSRNISSKEKMLTNVRNALINKAKQPFPNLEQPEKVYSREEDSLEVLFAQELKQVDGNFVYCESEQEMVDTLRELTEIRKWTTLLCPDPAWSAVLQGNGFTSFDIAGDVTTADAGIMGCEALVARTGSILISSALPSGRTLPVYPPANIVMATTDQLVFDLSDGLRMLSDKYGKNMPSMVNIATGPSRTADIEKTLVLGAHGPKEVYVFLLDKAQ
jgi:L-lactate dehydrogenase complex protein LldG